jgi:hypothetical protein
MTCRSQRKFTYTAVAQVESLQGRSFMARCFVGSSVVKCVRVPATHSPNRSYRHWPRPKGKQVFWSNNCRCSSRDRYYRAWPSKTLQERHRSGVFVCSHQRAWWNHRRLRSLLPRNQPGRIRGGRAHLCKVRSEVAAWRWSLLREATLWKVIGLSRHQPASVAL